MKNKKKMCFGVIIGTRAYFNSELAKDVRKQLLETLTKEGYDYVILPEDATPTGSSSIETREDGLKCAKLFRENRERIDGIIVSLPNFGFEIGIINAISVADLNVPVLVQACDDENDKVDLDSRRDAFCGKISVCNNLYQYGIPFTDTTLHTYSIYSDLLAADINKFAAICRVVNGLRHARIGAIGTRPAGFQTVRYIGGGHKRMYRHVDFKRVKDGVAATVKTIEYDPNRTARIALVVYADGEKSYVP